MSLAMMMILNETGRLVSERKQLDRPTDEGNLTRAKIDCHKIANGFGTLSRMIDCGLMVSEITTVDVDIEGFTSLKAVMADMLKSIELLNKAYFIAIRVKQGRSLNGDEARIEELIGLYEQAETRLILAHVALADRLHSPS